jgi:GH15 family glucan-1,4-alpha-glucosidase
MEVTAEIVEQVLASGSTAGLKRYEYDSYIGGNPWIIASLWAALYHIERKSYTKAREYFEWAVKGVTDQELLPEQVDRDTGKPVWVIPLTWSHAKFILVLDGLAESGTL